MFCREHVAQLREHEQAFRDKGADLAAIGLGDRLYARLFREDTGITFPLLVDERREAYHAAGLRTASLLHLVRRDNATARRRARRRVSTTLRHMRPEFIEFCFLSWAVC